MATTATVPDITSPGSMAATQSDPWVVQPKERARFEEQFRSLQPVNGIITGVQAKDFMLQSQLPPAVLGQIWSLSDTDADGKMDINEFSIACKLIMLTLLGHKIPKTLPPSLLQSVKNQTPTIPPLPANNQLINMGTDLNNGFVGNVKPPVPKPPIIPPQPVQPPLIPAMGAPIVPTVPQTIPSQIPGMTPIIQPQGVIQQPIVMNPPAMGLTHSVGPISQPVGILPQTVGGIAQPLPGITQSIAGLNQTVLSQPSIAAPLIQSAPTGILPNTVLPGTIPAPIVTTKPAEVKPPISVPSAAGTPTSRSIDRIASLDSPGQPEWAVPHATKLKYTQLFNTTDRSRSGYLSGPQARNLMIQSKLPQAMLAQIWALADMDSDGRLSCDEFVLAMHLCEQGTLGKPPPAVLPIELIPPTFRRTSVSSVTGSQVVTTSRHGSLSSQGSQHADDPASILLQTTFEDKRKENFEKGQAELERRRRALLEAQRAEAEVRERKEREEQERRERAKADQERKRHLEIQQQIQEQQQKEQKLEEERKRQQEQKEAARREMERQRQLEWEKQRSQELQQQRQRSQENVLRLKARNQSLTIELSSLTEQVKELSQKICNTRVGVSNVKTTIDGMRSTRDTYMQELSQLKAKLKDQNHRLIMLTQEKVKLDAKNKINLQNDQEALDQTQVAFDNKEIVIKQLKDKLSDLSQQVNSKMNDIDNNNVHLSDLTTQLTTMVQECEDLYNKYEEKKQKVLQMKGSDNNNAQPYYESAWKDDNAWNTPATTDDWPAPATTTAEPTGAIKYRALYEFVGRNQDEISFQPGDIIMVPAEQNGEPGWLAGEIRGHMGWFPQSYVELIDGDAYGPDLTSTALTGITDDISMSRPLEGIEEVPEVITDSLPPVVESIETAEYFVACYPYQSVEQGDLSFNAGELIAVLKKDGEWWTGKIGDRVGIFPSNYVQKSDSQVVNGSKPFVDESANAHENGQTTLDAEISAINESRKSIDKSPDFSAMSSNTQTLTKSSKKPEIASVLAPYQATSPEQLSLERGQLIMIRKKSDTGWWEGELQAKGRRRQVGWFPATYVKVLESSGRASGRNTPVSASRTDQQEMILDKVIALFPYTAQNADELTFAKDDIISVTSREEADWWRGELNGVSGLFPSNYVGPLQYSPRTNGEEKKRFVHISELVSSEKMYIDDLINVLEVFEKPLILRQALTTNDVKQIFLNWRNILSHNQRFYDDLILKTDQETSTPIMIGDIILKHIPKMTPYIKFCSNQLKATAFLQNMLDESSAFRNELQKCQSNPKTKGMPLSSFLIKPMQRITKYPLILDKILENTPPDHPDYVQLAQALEATEKFCKKINEIVRVTENNVKLNWIQQNVVCENLNIKFISDTNSLGPRQLLHHGTLTKVKSGKELVGFLFNDFLLLAQCNKLITSQEFTFYKGYPPGAYKMYKQPFFLNEITCTNELQSSGENGFSALDYERALIIKTPNTNLLLYAPTANECTLWIKKISDSQLNLESSKKITFQRQRSEREVIKGRLLVVVQNGAQFTRVTGKPVCTNVYCELTVADQQNRTDCVNATLNPKLSRPNLKQNGSPLTSAIFVWNAPMQFLIYDFFKDILELSVYEQCLFTPNNCLGKSTLKILDILPNDTHKSSGPFKKKMILQQSTSGEVNIKLDLHVINDKL